MSAKDPFYLAAEGATDTNPSLREALNSALNTLTFREREIIRMHWGVGYKVTYTLVEVARIFHVSQEHVRRIEKKALEKLGAPGVRKGLEGWNVPR